MTKKKNKQALDQQAIDRLKKEMAEPRMANSVRIEIDNRSAYPAHSGKR